MMLLSSVAETMFWSGRYIERAQAMARAIQAVERVSLDLPGRHALDLRPLLALVAAEAVAEGQESSQTTQLRALALNSDDPSSVLGALSAARENLRQARVVVPPELWVALNDQYQRLKEVTEQPVTRVVEALEIVLQTGRRIEGEARNGMARDAAYRFFQIGVQIERADMLLRVLGALLPALSASGWERPFDDVRWAGLLSALGLRSMYRRRHHHHADLQMLLDFLVADMACPRSVVHCLRLVDDELGMLPHASRIRTTLRIVTSRAFELSRALPEAVTGSIELTLDALADVHNAVQVAYFPQSAAAEQQASDVATNAAEDPLDPFQHLGREHAQVECAMRVLEALAAQATAEGAVDKSDLAAIMDFLTEFDELGHHEKEELLLTPRLVEHGFDWFEGPIAAMRREHRHEHFFIRVLSQLATQRAAWSREDCSRFATDTREFTHFLRAHMDRERRDLFEQARRSLSAQVKLELGQAFLDYDRKQVGTLSAARAKIEPLLRKYGCSQ